MKRRFVQVIHIVRDDLSLRGMVQYEVAHGSMLQTDRAGTLFVTDKDEHQHLFAAGHWVRANTFDKEE